MGGEWGDCGGKARPWWVVPRVTVEFEMVDWEGVMERRVSHRGPGDWEGVVGPVQQVLDFPGDVEDWKVVEDYLQVLERCSDD